VCGHTNCGAIKGILHPELLEEMPTVKIWLSHGEAARRIVKENYSGIAEEQIPHVLAEENVVAQLANLRTHPSVAARLARKSISLHGWMYHIATGQVEEFDPERGRFVPLEAHGTASAPEQPRYILAG
jgi:carbonic anhydrase